MFKSIGALRCIVFAFFTCAFLVGCGGSSSGTFTNPPPTNPPTNPPAAPSGLQAVAGNASATLTWAAVAGATSYRVYRSSIPGGPYTQIASPTVTTFGDTGLSNGTPYYYVVRAHDGTRESVNSTEVTITPSVSLPTAPTGVSASTLNATITLNWSAVSGASEYHIYRAPAAGGTYDLVGSTASLTFTDTELTDGTTYYYVVRASTDEGESTNSQEVSATIQRFPAPAGVAVARGDRVLAVSWQAVNGATHYNIFRSTTSGGPYTNIASRTTTRYVDPALINDTTYYYVVRANDADEESLNSAEVSGTPKNLVAPPPSTPPSTDFSSLTGWTKYDGYALREPTDPGNFASIDSTGSQLSIQIPGGEEHNMWLLRHAAALAPTYPGTGIYETKLDSTLTGNQQFGLVFRQDENTFLIFMVYAEADDQIVAYAERFVNVAPDDPTSTGKETFPSSGVGVPLGMALPAAGPFHLRVAVTEAAQPGDRSWTFSWSPNGIDWSVLIDQDLEGSAAGENIGTIAQVGVFAGNQPNGLDEFDARFDYFHYYPDEASMPAPTPPNFSARGGDNQVELWWDAVTGVDSYNVYSATDPAGPFTLLANLTGTTLTDSSVANGSPRSYLIRALRGGFEGAASQTVTATAHVLSEFATLPTDGLLVALSASELSTLQLANGDQVTQWPNVIGPQIAARGVLNGMPTFVASSLNGKPTVNFDGDNDFLLLPPGFDDFTAGISIYIVMRPTAATPGMKVLTLANSQTDEVVLVGRTAIAPGFQYATTDSGSQFGVVESSDGFVLNEAATLSILQDGGAADALVNAQIARNGAALTGGSGSAYVPPVETRSLNYIGKSLYSNNEWLEGDIAEVFIYNRKLTVAEDQAIRGYFSAKYSLP